ncbi:hypothetical protein V502_00317 [Pseudogymnoascus sp. VKM F-4520 (FW-2644)]|nr:hypothetical protein V502_00317 [Pseudogymnoascus sp. VKM F-4520 (FW-2644)]
MASTNEIRYFFPRDSAESERLNSQHEAWMSDIGYALHPSIQTHESMRVADIGTGTGIWLYEVAQHLSATSQLDGFDISPSQFPDPKDTPSNMTFRVQDLLQPFADELLGKYDVIHIRFMCFALSRNEWEQAVKNLVALLKPGGYLQWGDAAIGTLRAATTDPTQSTRYMEKSIEVISQLAVATNKDFSCVERLPLTFKEQGLANCVQTHVESDATLTTKSHFNVAMLLGIESILTTIVKFGGNDVIKNNRNVREMMSHIDDELSRGAFFWYKVTVTIGRRPL